MDRRAWRDIWLAAGAAVCAVLVVLPGCGESEPPKTADRQAKDEPAARQVTQAEAASLKATAEEALERVARLDRWPGLAARLDEVDEAARVAESAFAGADWAGAKAAYEGLLEKCRAVEALEEQRMRAVAARSRFEAALWEQDEERLAKYGGQRWARVANSMKAAAAAGDDFEKAAREYGRASQLLPDAVQAAERAYKAALLATAKANNNAEHWRVAAKALDDLLRLEPDNEEAQALKEQIGDLYGPKVGDVFTNSIGMKFMYIPPGDFMMGTSDDDKIRSSDMEGPQHNIRIAKGFHLGKYEVTVGQFRAFIDDSNYETEAEAGNGGSGWIKGEYVRRKEFSWRDAGLKQTDDHPVVNVSWNDVQVFCEWLSAREKMHYRLPTEAEWEYACRAGTTTRYNLGDAVTVEQVNCLDGRETDDRRRRTTMTVGSFPANAWGLHDMHGNVREWCQTLMKSYPYQVEDDRESLVDRTMTRLMRGGSWFTYSRDARSAARYWNIPDVRAIDLGFRVCLELD